MAEPQGVEHTRQRGVFKVLTWNVRGLNDHRKVRTVLNYLKRQKIDIALLQETHLPLDSPVLKQKSLRDITNIAGYTSHARGVLTWVNPNSKFELTLLHSDPQGRYVISNCKGNSFDLILINVYGPNYDNPVFFTDLATLLRRYADRDLILGGDLNLICDPTKDRSGGPARRVTAAAKVLGSIMTDYDLKDVWRSGHSEPGGYTHYSSQYQLHTRIDYWLISTSLLPSVEACAILPRTLSDHSPIALSLKAPPTCIPPYTWRFPPYSLLDPLFKDELATEIDNFFQINVGSVESFLVVWETFKVFIRGIVMAKHSGVLRAIRNRLTRLEGEIRAAELLLESQPDPSLELRLKDLLTDFHEEADHEVKHLGKYAVARTYGEGDRPGTVLARLLSAKRRRVVVTGVTAATGELLTDEAEIATRFRDYYATLYATRTASSDAHVTEYLEYIKMPFLTNDHREQLMRPIEKDEIVAALKGMKTNGAPGIDGLTVGFYRTFIDQLLPHLQMLYDEICLTGEMPPSMREALIVAIPKPGKPPTECSSYRPLSLLTVDNKIFAKILANRLSPLMHILVAPEQAGFIPTRNITYNLRTVFGILQHINPDAKAAAIFLDMEKAFDSVEWPFLRQVLARLGLGPVFLQLVGTLYNSLTARIRLGDLVTAPIQVSRGTRQGCPLSPLLYALVAEPLACALREYHDVRGLNFRGYRIIISTYADDTLLYVRDPETNLDPVLREVVQFGSHSGLRVNWQKSVIFPLTHATRQFDSEFPLTWTTDSIRYLGIQIHTDSDIIFRENYGAAVHKLETDVESWIRLPLSLLGRISIMKMVVLPRFLFLFLNIPMVLPIAFFSRLHSIMIRLAWAGKSARIKWTTLTLPYHMGGLGAPDFLLYYRAAQCAVAYHWIHGTPDVPFVRLERLFTDPLQLPASLSQTTDRRTGILDSVNSVKHAMAGLLHMRAGGLLYSPSMPLEWLGWLPQCGDRGVVRALHHLGITIAGDLFADSTVKEWTDLGPVTESATQLQKFQFYRVRGALRQILGGDLQEPPEIPELTYLITATTPRGLVSKLYQIAMTYREQNFLKARRDWQIDLQCSIDDPVWKYCCTSTRRISLHGGHRLLHCKFLHRAYYTPERMHRYGLTDSAACIRCTAEPAGFFHLAWQCPNIFKFWESVFLELRRITDTPLEINPLLALLGYSKPLPPGIRRLIDMGLLLAKRQVALHWMKGPPPTMTQWAKDMLYCSTQTEAYSDLLPPRNRPKNFWGLYLTYVRTQPTIPTTLVSDSRTTSGQQE